MERYDIERNVWNKIEHMMSPKCTLSCVVSVPDFRYVYAVGGFNGKPLDTVERYDITSEQWEQLRKVNMRSRRFMHSAIFVCM